MSDPRNARDISANLRTDMLDGISDRGKANLITFMARLAERSYRRGYQQGVTVQRNRPGDIRPDLHDWRYQTSTDRSPWPDSQMAEKSISRLFMENRTALLAIGIEDPEYSELPRLSDDRSWIYGQALASLAADTARQRKADPNDEVENGAAMTALVEYFDRLETDFPDLVDEIAEHAICQSPDIAAEVRSVMVISRMTAQPPGF